MKKSVGHVNDFPEGEGTRVNIDGIEIAIFNVGGSYFGIQNMCPHKRLPIHRSKEVFEDAGGAFVMCPWHYMEFDLKTGEQQSTHKRIATYDVELEDGQVFVEL